MLLFNDTILFGRTAPISKEEERLGALTDEQGIPLFERVTDGSYTHIVGDYALRKRTAAEIRELPEQRQARAAQYKLMRQDRLLYPQYLTSLIEANNKEIFQ